MDVSTVLLTVIVCSCFLYYFFCRNLSHFKRLGIPHVPPIPFFGNMAAYVFRKMAVVEILQQIYNRFPEAKYVGFFEFGTPVIMIRDPELVASVTVKNFENFSDHRAFIDADLDPLFGKNLFALRGAVWRDMRKLISPTFTASKMKMMYELVRECAENFVDCLVKESKNGKDIEMKEALGRYANDVVASCAFGINVDSMKNPKNEFYILAKNAMNFDGILSVKIFLGRNFSSLMKFFGIRLFSEKVAKFFEDILTNTIKTREELGIVRPDLIQIMMEGKKDHTMDLSLKDMTAQAFIFFLAGFDSVSTFMSFLTYEMAANIDVQKRLRREIEEVLKETNGQPTYESVMNLKYLDAVVNETLRLWPLTSFLDRICVKDFELPPPILGAKPVRIPVGTNLWIPSYSLHRDPKYYSNPNKFDPDRFLEGNVNEAVFTTFGAGPRFCIGNRFALMESKMMLFYLILYCDLEPCAKTRIPVKLSEKSFTLMAKGGFWMKIRARNLSKIMNEKMNVDEKNELVKE